jgi:hypothetical protein
VQLFSLAIRPSSTVREELNNDGFWSALGNDELRSQVGNNERLGSASIGSAIWHDHVAVAARGRDGRCNLAFAFVSKRQPTVSDSPYIWPDLLTGFHSAVQSSARPLLTTRCHGKKTP